MLFKTAKVNEFRLWGLLLTMGGMLLMILGLVGIVFNWGTVGRVIAAIFMIVGLISVMASMAVYFWAGMLSTSAIVIECPSCGKATKMLGKTDRCMFCKSVLSLDPAHAPQASEQKPAADETESLQP